MLSGTEMQHVTRNSTFFLIRWGNELHGGGRMQEGGLTLGVTGMT